MVGLPLVAILVVFFLIDKPEDVGLAGFSLLIAAAALWRIARTQGARERLVGAWA